MTAPSEGAAVAMTGPAPQSLENLRSDVLAHQQAILRGRNDLRLGRIPVAEQEQHFAQLEALHRHEERLRAELARVEGER